MPLSIVKREPSWFFIRRRICFYQKSRNILGCDVTSLKKKRYVMTVIEAAILQEIMFFATIVS